jgi:hypothetical protein
MLNYIWEGTPRLVGSQGKCYGTSYLSISLRSWRYIWQRFHLWGTLGRSRSTFRSARAWYLVPTEYKIIGLSIGLIALGGVSHSILSGGVPTLHVVLALMIAGAVLEWALLPRAEPTERPVNGYAAIASRPAILMRVAVLILDQADALPLLLFMSDSLDVLATISCRV